jgi:hypothetical protein
MWLKGFYKLKRYLASLNVCHEYPKSKMYEWEDKSSTSREINCSWIANEYRVRFAFVNCKYLYDFVSHLSFSQKKIKIYIKNIYKVIFPRIFFNSRRCCSHIYFPKGKLASLIIWSDGSFNWLFVRKRKIYTGDDDGQIIIIIIHMMMAIQ